MIAIPEPRFETGRPMLTAGVRRTHRFQDAARDIPRQWDEFNALTIPGGAVAYGVMCGSDLAAGTFEYMAAREVTAFEALPPELGRVRIPEARYAVFDIPDVGSIQPVYQAVYSRWLPTSGYRNANSPDFERYGPGFDPNSGVGDIELWWPIEPA